MGVEQDPSRAPAHHFQATVMQCKALYTRDDDHSSFSCCVSQQGQGIGTRVVQGEENAIPRDHGHRVESQVERKGVKWKDLTTERTRLLALDQLILRRTAGETRQSLFLLCSHADRLRLRCAQTRRWSGHPVSDRFINMRNAYSSPASSSFSWMLKYLSS